MPGFTAAGIAAAVASALASVGGTIASSQARAKIKRKQNQRTLAESARQRDIEERRQREISEGLDEFVPEEQEEKRAEISDNLESYFTPATTENPADYLPGDRTAPKEIRDQQENSITNALRIGKGYAKDTANLKSYATQGINNKLFLNRMGERVGDLNSEGIRSSSLLPGELQGAYTAGVPYQNAAAAFSGVGGIADSILSYQLFKGGSVPSGGGTGLNNMNVRGGPGNTTIPLG